MLFPSSRHATPTSSPTPNNETDAKKALILGMPSKNQATKSEAAVNFPARSIMML